MRSSVLVWLEDDHGQYGEVLMGCQVFELWVVLSDLSGADSLFHGGEYDDI